MEILSIDGYFKHQIARILQISKNGVDYCLQWQAETGTNVDRKRSKRPRVKSIAEDEHLIMFSKRNRGKIASELTAEFNSTCQHTISVKRRLLSVRLKRYESVKKPLSKNKNKLKRIQWAQQYKNWTLKD